MNWTPLAEGVFESKEPVVVADDHCLPFLKNEALKTSRRRARLCAHPDRFDPVHEMLIALSKETYIRPHAHLGKSESFHIIEGEADLILFDDHGIVQRVIPLGPVGSGRTFFFRLKTPVYHTVLVNTEFLVFHETTTGPFNPDAATAAAWAPTEQDSAAAASYTSRLRGMIQNQTITRGNK